MRALVYTLALIMSAMPICVHAQELITLSGTIADKNTRKAIEAASITIPGTDIGTISNADGYFSLRISATAAPQQLLISHIGYDNLYHSIGEGKAENIKLYLSPNAYALEAVKVYSGNARDVVAQAVEKISTNYEDKSNKLTGFYREVIQKRRNYVTVTEAVVDLYKSPYQSGIRNDRVQINKGRKIIDHKAADTVMVKLAGGPIQAVYLDIAKNMEFMLDKRELENYDFTYSVMLNIDNRSHYAINFKPRLITNHALFSGTMYIDEKTLTISRVEVQLTGDELEKATKDILRKKPTGMRFKLNDLTYTISYRQSDGRSYLHYVGSEMKFQCDWRRRLFHTNYTIASEMVTTDRERNPSEGITAKDAFKQSQSLTDRVADFYDPDFWGNYNIIEPTESLENAIGRIKKQRR